MRSPIIGVLVPHLADERQPGRACRDVLAALWARGRGARAIPVDHDLGGALRRERVQLAFLALEGRAGDDGSVQAALEAAGVPHTGPAAPAAALAGDRARARDVLRRCGLPTPPSYLVPAGLAAERLRERHGDLGYPVLVRSPRRASPLAAARAIGPDALAAACARAGEEVLVERVTPGPRVRIALLDGRPLGAELVTALPEAQARVVERDGHPGRPRGRRAAVDARAARPAGARPSPASLIGARRLEGILRQAAAAARALGLVGPALVEIALDPDANEVVLDADPAPCLARGAPMARIARAAGIRFDELVDAIAGAAAIEQPLAA